jgi:thiopurine S-methyltransferase
MKIDFWKQRWVENQTGFHLNKTNPCLIHYWLDLGFGEGDVVFVPLCGKSLDLTWLSNQGHNVIGLECSDVAVKSFYKEQKLPYQQGKYKEFNVFNSELITLLQGDFFDIDSELMEEVRAVYDRASLIALPEDMRKAYVNKLSDTLPDNVKILLVTLEYNQQLMSGPPYSVSENEVRELYSQSFVIKKLHQQDVLENELRFKKKGLDYLLETVYLLSRN